MVSFCTISGEIEVALIQEKEESTSLLLRKIASDNSAMVSLQVTGDEGLFAAG